MNILSIIQEQKSKFNIRRNKANNLKETIAEEEFQRQKTELKTLKERRQLLQGRQDLGREVASEKAKLLEMGEGTVKDKIKLRLKRMREEAKLRQQNLKRTESSVKNRIKHKLGRPPQQGMNFGNAGFGDAGFGNM